MKQPHERSSLVKINEWRSEMKCGISASTLSFYAQLERLSGVEANQVIIESVTNVNRSSCIA